ncbi:MAG TPA: c-type cytochrome [Candidatus Limnocylindrales bacterium]|nr:c-type cytochrome [Candidatus Limnocylindrales bacterium]
MSDERSGRELTPRPEEEPRAVTPRESSVAPASTLPADRFYAGDQAHTVGLTEERTGQIVRQSGNARMAAFLGALFLVLFIPLYWIYDIGLPFIGVGGRMEAEQNTQYVTDVARGHALYLANCARCHGDNGEGGIGPVLNDQGKLYNSLTAAGLPGPGHFKPEYLHAVLREGGRYVCGDPNSIMPPWEAPRGPLNYREVEEIITFMLASEDVTWTIHHTSHAGEEPGAIPEPDVEHRGWRDPNYEPPPDATPVPACWHGDETPAPATPAPVESPGTAENPRVIEIAGTEQIQWVNPSTGERITSITVVEGETIEFRIINESEFVPHNFHIGSADELASAPQETDLPGTETFTGGTRTFVFTVEDMPDQPQFACTVPGHYTPMHGDFIVTQQPGTGNGDNGEGESPAPESPAPGASP